MLLQLSKIHQPPQLRSNATILRADNAPSIEAGLPVIPLRAGRKRRFVWTDFDPTTPGGASAKAAA